MMAMKSEKPRMMWASLAIAAGFLLASHEAGAMSQRSDAPTAIQIEALFHRAQVETHPRLPPSYWHAKLLDFDLRQLEASASSRWVAIVDLAFDFGPAPAGVIGFQRERGGEYRLELQREDGEIALRRFAPLRGVRPLARR